MPVYRLEIAPEASKVLAELPSDVAAELSDRLDELPVLLELTGAGGALSGRARMALMRLAASGIDLFLAGHLHVGITEKIPLRFNVGGRSPLLLQAGSATSSRRRGHPNSFNFIRVHRPWITVERFDAFDTGEIFRRAAIARFEHTDAGWIASDEELVKEISLVTRE